MLPIKRTRITEQLVEELVSSLKNSETCVVVAPVYGGKSMLAHRVSGHLSKSRLNVLHFEFPPGRAEDSETEVLSCLINPPPQLRTASSLASFFDDLCGWALGSNRKAVFILNHLDGLSRELARRFVRHLAELKKCLTAGCAALITTEAHVFDLFLGPDAEFDYANKYLLQGYGPELFRELVEKSQIDLSISFDAELSLDDLWRLTGGNIYLVWNLIKAKRDEHAISGGGSKKLVLTTRDIERFSQNLAQPGVEECALFREAMEIIHSKIECLDLLSELICTGRVELSPEFVYSAHSLEVVGVAHYRDGFLLPSSELMDRFLKAELSSWSLGNLYALAGDWESAFSWYARQSGRLTRSPNFRERVVSEEVIRRLDEFIKSSMPEEVHSLFNRSLRSLFGIHQVFRCKRAPSGWNCSGEISSLLLDELARNDTDEFTVSNNGIAIHCFTGLGGSKEAFAADATSTPSWVRTQVPKIFKAYAETIVSIEYKERTAEAHRLRGALGKAIGNIVNGLYVELISPQDVLRKASEELRRSGAVRDAIFWLASDTLKLRSLVGEAKAAFTFTADEMNPVQEVLRGSDDVRILERDEWPEALGASEAEKSGGTCMLFPIRAGGHNSGVFCVALNQGVVPDGGEIYELKQFAGQLAAAVAHAGRISRVSVGLDCIGEPILILDDSKRVIFSNSAARSLLGVPANPGTSEPFSIGLGPEFQSGIQTAFEQSRYVDFPTRIRSQPYEGTVVYERLRNHLGDLLGVLIHIQPKSYYADLLSAARALEQSRNKDEALMKLSQIFQEFGHHWIRIYRVKEDALIPDQCVDPARPNVEKAFKTIELPGRGDSASWKAIITGRPYVFSWNLNVPDREAFFTERGLRVISVHNPPAAVELDKHPDDYWVELPLFSGTDVLGKIAISCAKDLTPERFRVLHVLSELIGETFAVIGNRRRDFLRAERVTKQVMSDIRGVFYDQLASLDVIIQLIENVLKTATVADEPAAHYSRSAAMALDGLRETFEKIALSD